MCSAERQREGTTLFLSLSDITPISQHVAMISECAKVMNDHHNGQRSELSK